MSFGSTYLALQFQKGSQGPRVPKAPSVFAHFEESPHLLAVQTSMEVLITENIDLDLLMRTVKKYDSILDDTTVQTLVDESPY